MFVFKINKQLKLWYAFVFYYLSLQASKLILVTSKSSPAVHKRLTASASSHQNSSLSRFIIRRNL